MILTVLLNLFTFLTNKHRMNIKTYYITLLMIVQIQTIYAQETRILPVVKYSGSNFYYDLETAYLQPKEYVICETLNGTVSMSYVYDSRHPELEKYLNIVYSSHILQPQ